MAQTGYTPISIYYSSTATNVPTAGNLVAGELAINTADGKLFYKDSAGVVQVIGTKGGVGSSTTTQVLYNSSGLVVGSANMTFNGTTLTLANDASISGLTVGKGGGTNSAVFGVQAGNSNTGNNVVSIGYQAGFNNTDSSGSVYIGYIAGKSNTSGTANAFVGSGAGTANTTGGNNSAFGYLALYTNTTGSSNTAIGDEALRLNTTASQNTAVGYQALYTNTTGSYNTAVGYVAGQYNTTGHITALGSYALQNNTTGNGNTAVGGNDTVIDGALYLNTTGSYNTAMGTGALKSNTTASNNTAVGYQAGYSNTTNGSSTYLGYQSGYAATGTLNTFAGYASGFFVTSGTKNSILGSYSGNQGGLDIRTASNYIVLSDGDGNPNGYCDANSGWHFGKGGTSSTYDGFIALNGAAVSDRGAGVYGYANGTYNWGIGSYSLIVGGASNGSLTCRNISGGVYLSGTGATSWTAVSDETRKDIIEPITGGLAKVSTLRTVIGKLKTDEEGVRRPYLIAQDVQKVLPEAVSETEDGEGKVLGLSYTEVIPLLVNAIQELKAEIDQLKAK